MKRSPLPRSSDLLRWARRANGAWFVPGVIGLTLATLPPARAFEGPAAPASPTVAAPTVPSLLTHAGSGGDSVGVAPSYTLEEAPPPPKPSAPKSDARTGRPRTRPSAKSSVSAAPPGGFPKADASNPISAPSISPKSMCEEVRRTLAEQQKNDARREEERRKLDDQKAALDKLAAEIAKARSELAAETTRLLELAKKTGTDKGPGSKGSDRTDKTAEKSASTPVELAAAATKATEGAPPRHTEGRTPPPSPQTLKAVRDVSEKIRYTRPRQAADIVRSLEPGLAAMVLKEMSPEFAGKVLEKLDKQLAADLLRRGVALEEKP